MLFKKLIYIYKKCCTKSWSGHQSKKKIMVRTEIELAFLFHNSPILSTTPKGKCAPKIELQNHPL